jgi:hypothetical protein
MPGQVTPLANFTTQHEATKLGRSKAALHTLSDPFRIPHIVLSIRTCELFTGLIPYV